MKIQFILPVALFGLLALNGCKNQDAATASAETVDAAVEDQQDNTMQKLIVDRAFSPTEDKATSIKAVSLDGDIMSVTVSYSGGCEAHAFELYSNQRYMKSLPPQLNLFLVHERNGDMCRELIEQTLKFDIKGARYSGNGSVKLMVNGNSEQAILYSYK